MKNIKGVFCLGEGRRGRDRLIVRVLLSQTKCSILDPKRTNALIIVILGTSCAYSTLLPKAREGKFEKTARVRWIFSASNQKIPTRPPPKATPPKCVQLACIGSRSAQPCRRLWSCAMSAQSQRA
ncbi:unnamed protein product [Arctogadus glacialis]